MVSGSSILIPQTHRKTGISNGCHGRYYRKLMRMHRGSYQLANEATAILEEPEIMFENSLTQIQRKKLCSPKMLPKR